VSELWTLGVEELVAGFGAGELDADEVVGACIARAREVNPALNCFVALDEEPSPPRRGPLRGVPYAYKDVFVHGAELPAVGVRRLALELRATRSTVLDRLEAAGSVALGRLNLDPLAYAATGLNPDFGDARNPWDTSRLSGGSSGGAAAAVAAGAVPFAIGTDAGGSVRIPAALCGVTGLKTTFGRIPKLGAAPLAYSQDTVGILARSARDVAIVLEHVAGYDPADPSSVRAPVPTISDLRESCVGLRLGVDRRLFAATTPKLAAAADAFLEAASGLGIELVDLDLSGLDRFDTAATVLTWAEASAIHGRVLAEQPERYPRTARARLELALAATGADHVDAMRFQGRAIAELLDGPLAAADVLVAPTISGPAPRIEAVERDAVSASLANLRLNRPFNYTGVPSVALPVGFDDDGLPLALQLAGRPWAEVTLLRVAAAYQQETAWHRQWPAVAARV
jgi:aspartyl-tRNA(Asn)/glutamyl-tRNA(Gln) amidotransferase subunit A